MSKHFAVFLFITTFSMVGWGKKKVIKPNQQLRIECHVLNSDTNVLDGLYYQYFEDELVAKGNYQQGFKEGKWEKFYRSGKVSLKANYHKGKKEGEWQCYYKNGQLAATIFFKNNKRSGRWQGYFPDGTKAAVCHFVEDSLFGEQVYYYENGEIGKYQNIEWDKGKRKFITATYYEDGKIFESYELWGGKLHGEYKKYHVGGGILWEHFEYQKGKLLAIKAMKNAQGTNMVFGNYNGENGSLRRYHANGELYAEEQFREGFKYGKATYFLDNIKRVEGFFIEGQKIGTWKFYSPFKKLLVERNFFGKGNVVYEVIYGVSGEEREEGELLKGLRQGTWKTFNYYGELLSQTNYKEGYEHGIYKRFDGNLVVEKGGYFFGEKVGKWQSFNRSNKVTFEEIYTKSVSFDTTTIKPKLVGVVFSPSSKCNFTKTYRKPQFVGEMINEDDYLLANLELAEEAKQYNVRGTVLAQLFIDEFGEVVETKIQRGIGFGCDEAVENAIFILPFYEPYLMNGLPTKTIIEKEFQFGEGF